MMATVAVPPTLPTARHGVREELPGEVAALVGRGVRLALSAAPQELRGPIVGAENVRGERALATGHHLADPHVAHLLLPAAGVASDDLVRAGVAAVDREVERLVRARRLKAGEPAARAAEDQRPEQQVLQLGVDRRSAGHRVAE